MMLIRELFIVTATEPGTCASCESAECLSSIPLKAGEWSRLPGYSSAAG